jgi:ribonuclease HII
MAVAVRRPSRRRAAARPGRRLLRFDRELGTGLVAGADEAGRGSLAGPLVAAAVLLDHRRLRGRACAPLGLLDDSKRRAAPVRERLFQSVLACAERVAVIVVPPQEIDARGLHRSNLDGLARALTLLDAPAQATLLTDGFRVPLGRDHLAVVDGDARSAAVAAASIVAKVTRDRLMHREHHRFPLYGFDSHVGYSTPMHRAAVRRHGPCELHRRSFMSIAYEQLVLLEHGEEEEE